LRKNYNFGYIKYEDLVFILCAALPNVGRGCLYI
jgi:hypothetical protein